MSLSIISKLSLVENKLTKKERKIAEYIVNNQEKITKMRIEELAKAISIGYSPIYSLISKLGFVGYRDFVISFTAENVQNGNEDFSASESGNLLTIYNALITSNLEINDPNEMENIVSLIIHAQNIYLCAFGDTALAAQELANRLRKMGIHAVAIKTDQDEVLTTASSLSNNDLWLVYSMSGTTKISINATKIAKENKASIFVATSKEGSKLLSYADTSWMVITPTTYDQSRILMSTLIPFLVLNDQIVTALVSRNKTYNENAQKVAQIVAKYN